MHKISDLPQLWNEKVRDQPQITLDFTTIRHQTGYCVDSLLRWIFLYNWHKYVWKGENMVPFVLNLGSSWKWGVKFYARVRDLRESVPDNHLLGSWVALGSVWMMQWTEELLALGGHRTATLGCPFRILASILTWQYHFVLNIEFTYQLGCLLRYRFICLATQPASGLTRLLV